MVQEHLKTKLDQAITQRNWEAALFNLTGLIGLNLRSAEHYYKLDKVHSYRGASILAKSAYITAINIDLKVSLDTLQTVLIERLHGKIGPIISCEYLMTNGVNNIGGFFIKAETGSFFTKVSKADGYTLREAIFYENSAGINPDLVTITADYIDHFTHRGLMFLTLQYVQERRQTGVRTTYAIHLSWVICFSGLSSWFLGR